METEEALEESTSSTEATVEEPTSIPNKISVKVGQKQYDFNPETFQQIADAHEKGQKWETSYHKKGEALNKLRDELYSERKEIDENKKTLEEYKKIKKAIEANPAAYTAMQKALNEQESVIPPAYKELEKKTHELESNMAYDRAVREIVREFNDFDEDTVRKFSYEYDVNNPKDMLTLYYHAWKGSQLPDLIEKAKTEVVLEAKKKQGLPPVGLKMAPSKELPTTLMEQWAAAKKRIESEGPLF